MDSKFCPFINGACRKDCTFHLQSSIASQHYVTPCIIAAKLDSINDMQHDDLTEILQAVENKKG